MSAQLGGLFGASLVIVDWEIFAAVDAGLSKFVGGLARGNDVSTGDIIVDLGVAAVV